VVLNAELRAAKQELEPLTEVNPVSGATSE